MNLTKLTGTSRLLLVTVISTSGLRDGLTVRNLLLVEHNLDLLVVLQTPFQSAQVELSLTLNQCLTELLALLQNPCWVFLAHLLDGAHHLFTLRLVLWLNRADIAWFWIFHQVKAVFAVLANERVARANVFQLHGATDVTGHQLLNLGAVRTGADIKLGDTLLAATVDVQKVVAFVNLTAHHLEVLNATDVWLVGCLEEIKGSWTVGVWLHLFTIAGDGGWHLVNEWNHIAQELHQTVHAHVLGGADAEHREHAAGCQTLADAFTHLVNRQMI